MKSPSGLSVVLIVFGSLIILYADCNREDPPGHLKPFGSHAPPVEVDRIDVVPNPVDFFENYIKPGKPVVMNGAAKKFENFKNWKNDDYIRKNFGRWLVNVDVGKYEGSVFGHSAPMTMKKFLNSYKEKEYYLINAITSDNPMNDEISLLKLMSCGGYLDHIHRVLLLFSSGATQSAMHFDDVENVHCVFDGTKEWLLYDRKLRSQLPLMEGNKAYVAIDCRSVDMYKYPIIQKLPWHRAFLNTGDCLFLPSGWAHHVKSEGNDRNMAMAVWFSAMRHFNKTDCPEDLDNLPDVISLGQKRMSKLEKAKGDVFSLFAVNARSKDGLLSLMKENDVDEDEAVAFINKIDTDKNDLITIEEIDALELEDILMLEHFRNEEEDTYFSSPDPSSSFKEHIEL